MVNHPSPWLLTIITWFFPQFSELEICVALLLVSPRAIHKLRLPGVLTGTLGMNDYKKTQTEQQRSLTYNTPKFTVAYH
jgi:hypothetical protein